MENAIFRKSFQFALRIVKLCRYLRKKDGEYVLTKQLLRSGTSIGANVAESQRAQSKADFVSKMNIALKETAESNYWLRLLAESGYLSPKEAESILKDCVEIEKLLVSILNASKR